MDGRGGRGGGLTDEGDVGVGGGVNVRFVRPPPEVVDVVEGRVGALEQRDVLREMANGAVTGRGVSGGEAGR